MLFLGSYQMKSILYALPLKVVAPFLIAYAPARRRVGYHRYQGHKKCDKDDVLAVSDYRGPTRHLLILIASAKDVAVK